ncbi:MAG: ABC transporter permease [Beijerinckiaceae bacterium]
MTLNGSIREAIAALRSNVLRSALTAIGVIVGVAGIIAIAAADAGATQTIEDQVAKLGVNRLSLGCDQSSNSGRRGPVVTLIDDDAKFVKDRVPEVAVFNTELDSSATIVAGDAAWTTEVWGTSASYALTHDMKMKEGRFFDEDEDRRRAKITVLGATVAKKLFGAEAPVDKKVRVNGVPMQVVGVRQALGRLGGQDMDDHIFVPINTVRTRLLKGPLAAPHQVNLVTVRVASGNDLDRVAKEIGRVIRERKHLPEGGQEKCVVENPAQFVHLMNSTHSALSGLLEVTTFIFLFVGGVGITNIMLVSVTERTREIGLRRAVGARRFDILAQFLTEAVVLCVAGGALGVLVGVAAGYVIAQSSGWRLIIEPWAVATAILASVGVGVAFGYFPARRAALLDPAEALARD